MAKTLEEILAAAGGPGGKKIDPAVLRQLQESAKMAGLSKRVIHIELDLISGNMKSQATPMDNVMHLGLIEFYKATVLAKMLQKPISKDDAEPEPSKTESPANANVPVPLGEGAMVGDQPAIPKGPGDLSGAIAGVEEAIKKVGPASETPSA